MIALVVLLVGLIGLARLQVIGMQVNQAGRAHTVAAQLAQELAGDSATRLGRRPGRADGGGRERSAAGLRYPARERRVRQLPHWSDSTPIPGVRPTRPSPSVTPTERRPSSGADGLGGGRWNRASLRREAHRGVGDLPRAASSIPFEVVYYVSQGNAGVAMANAAAFN